ncbi:murein biosynthesis integral membrane protein MurJ [Nocardioides sp. NBC_00850]|uniref:murein biosynthesis integral membrane protein MurJ n=1 Tax=Nocardioides sp. NBC_00850 TaxID=2976001 RepID=UPI003865A73A|nr:murein biosynthesis integral membrane protein MurJ [Nocardioides sp. NBC_00850]
MTATEQKSGGSSVLANSAVMAAGTLFSRASGFIRSALLVAALGNGMHADAFNIANTVPNMLYILLAGGVFNAVLVPQLVKAQKKDEDGGAAYTNRIITLAGLFLGVVTIVLVLGAPLLMNLYLGDGWYLAANAAELESAIDFARWCLPQVFFYGMFVLVGQVLNSRGSFGPMMWAPIANNIIAISTLAVYLFVFGPASTGGFTTGQEALLGLGSTLGIVLQFLLLLPVLHKTGVRYRPRFDFRGAGLSHTGRLAVWTVLFVIVNQVAYTIVVNLASEGAEASSGYTVYTNSFLVTQVPHSIITVSLATAILPLLSRYGAAGELSELGRTLSRQLRNALAIVIPIAALLPVLSVDIAQLLFGYGAGADSYRQYAPTLSVFAAGLVFFTIHYLLLRGFYSLEQNRTVFFIQCSVATTNIVAALLLTRAVSAEYTAPALAAAYTLSYLVGSVVSYVVLKRTLGDLDGRGLLGFLARLVMVTAVAAAAAWLLRTALGMINDEPTMVLALIGAAIVGALHLGMLLLGAQAAQVKELNTMVQQVARRLRR